MCTKWFSVCYRCQSFDISNVLLLFFPLSHQGETTIKYAAVGLQFIHVFMRSKCEVKWECLTRGCSCPLIHVSPPLRFTCLHCVNLSGCLSNTAAVMFNPGFTCTYAVITEHQENVRLNAGDEEYWVKMKSAITETSVINLHFRSDYSNMLIFSRSCHLRSYCAPWFPSSLQCFRN